MQYVKSAVGKGSNRKIKKFLFNLDNDFSDQRNIIDIYPKKAAKMKTMLDKWNKEVCSETPEQTL